MMGAFETTAGDCLDLLEIRLFAFVIPYNPSTLRFNTLLLTFQGSRCSGMHVAPPVGRFAVQLFKNSIVHGTG